MFVFSSYPSHKFRFYQGFYRLSRGVGIFLDRESQESATRPDPSTQALQAMQYVCMLVLSDLFVLIYQSEFYFWNMLYHFPKQLKKSPTQHLNKNILFASRRFIVHVVVEFNSADASRCLAKLIRSNSIAIIQSESFTEATGNCRTCDLFGKSKVVDQCYDIDFVYNTKDQFEVVTTIVQWGKDAAESC